MKCNANHTEIIIQTEVQQKSFALSISSAAEDSSMVSLHVLHVLHVLTSSSPTFALRSPKTMNKSWCDSQASIIVSEQL